MNRLPRRAQPPATKVKGQVSARIGAALFVVWGLLHIGLGAVMLLDAGSSSPAADDLAAESTMFFVCAIIFGCQAIGVATTLNWHNRPTGVWLNGVVLGAVDIVFVFVMVLPGHTDITGGLTGPVVWLVATGFAIAARPSSADH